MTNQILERKFLGTSKLLSRLILLCNTELGWPLRVTHGELGVVYVEYRAHGATITVYGSLITPTKDNLDIHLRIHEFSGDMSALMTSLSNQIEDASKEAAIQDNRYVIFEDKQHAAIPKDNKITKKNHGEGKPNERGLL
jgi:hypothetical protein